MVGSGCPLGPNGPKYTAHAAIAQKDKAGEKHVLRDRAGHKRNAIFVRQLVIFLHVRRAANDSSRHRPFVDSELQHQEQMQADECNQRSRDHEHMQREESRKRRARDDRASQQKVHDPRPQNRYAAGNGRSDAQSPISVLIESKHLAGKGHSERQEEQKNTHHPGQLSGEFVSSEKEDLHHVDQDDRDHEIRAPAVQSANEPAERDLVIENLQAVPCFSRGGHIKEREQNAGDKLEHEHRERGAAENVSPACGLARDRVLHGLPDRRGKLQARIEPVAHFLDQAHGGFPAEMLIRLAVGAPVVGISPAWINRFPCSTL